jgi:tripartite-type tricarboxylate transporter receptor subunit TctC
VPAAGEFFPEIMKYDWTSWFGIMAPTGTPNDAVETLHKAMISASSDAELVKRYSDLGMGTSKMSLPEVRQFINRQFEVWVPAIKAMDLKLD